jgi:hypothetical protein
MDPIIWAIAGGLVIAAIIATLYALNRSWGNFPKDTLYRPPSGSSAPGMSAGPSVPSSQRGSWDAPASAMAPLPAPELPDPDNWVVPIEHPMVRRAAEQALERGGPSARYVIRQGDQIAFDFSQISDPLQRRQAYALMRRFADGQDVDIRAMIQVMRQMFSS